MPTRTEQVRISGDDYDRTEHTFDGEVGFVSYSLPPSTKRRKASLRARLMAGGVALALALFVNAWITG